eukprot:TRINITY_DN34760_c0_g1_i1.p1 TRINITY_DN34760_c0_g1~~TRINITY_DN34760_c0_g1_i1.p1  ORF type:complete len:406 (+),score=62.40 TRINITY_DN34760_c0_g1_i1:57-1274(+)
MPAAPPGPRRGRPPDGARPNVAQHSIGDNLRRAYSTPAPQVPQGYTPTDGVRWSGAQKPQSYFDVAPALHESNPAPGSYESSGSIQPNRAVGHNVYSYESATSGATRELLDSANHVPGPGQYQLPDPYPIGGTPSFRGQAPPRNMPHPVAQHFAPVSHKLAPVRRQNNAEQIFGNGSRQGGPANIGGRTGSQRSGSKSRLGSKSDHQVAQLAELPFGVGGEDKPPEHSSVQWQSGGFSVMKKKSRSAGGVKFSDVHPLVEHGVGQFYPALKAKDRANSAFLPMSSRRTERVSTRSSSSEGQHLGHSKWKMGRLADNLQAATESALEPLDIERLKRHAMKGLRDKAINRMKLQGVSREQQQVILEEMASLLQERASEPFLEEAAPTSMADFMSSSDAQPVPDAAFG